MSTKKKTALGVAVAGAAAVALTAGTFATFSDTDGQNVSAGAGTVVLHPTQGGASLSNMAPGETRTHTFNYTNTGSLPATLQLGNINVTGSENGCYDPEQESGLDCDVASELLDALIVSVTVPGLGTYNLGALSSIPSGGLPAGIVNMTPGETESFTVNFHLPEETENEVQSDTANVTMDATLTQS